MRKKTITQLFDRKFQKNNIQIKDLYFNFSYFEGELKFASNDMDYYSKNISISAIIIFKKMNIEIYNLIDSLSQQIDEFILVNTGSSNNMDKKLKHLKIALPMTTLKLFKFRWNDNFSEVRNFALDKCTKEWVFVVDADETIYKQTNIKKLIRSTLVFKNYRNIIISCKKANLFGKQMVTSFDDRIFYNSKRIKYKYSIHEQLCSKGNLTYLYTDNIILNHTPFDYNSKKSFYYYNLVLKEWREHPEDIFLIYLLIREGRQYTSDNFLIQVVEAFLGVSKSGELLTDKVVGFRFDEEFLFIILQIYINNGDTNKANKLLIKIKKEYSTDQDIDLENYYSFLIEITNIRLKENKLLYEVQQIQKEASFDENNHDPFYIYTPIEAFLMFKCEKFDESKILYSKLSKNRIPVLSEKQKKILGL